MILCAYSSPSNERLTSAYRLSSCYPKHAQPRRFIEHPIFSPLQASERLFTKFKQWFVIFRRFSTALKTFKTPTLVFITTTIQVQMVYSVLRTPTLVRFHSVSWPNYTLIFATIRQPNPTLRSFRVLPFQMAQMFQ